MCSTKPLKKILSHSEAIEEIYRLTPQIQDYDSFMHVGARWMPYTMYFHYKNFTSNSINTDDYGFRYSYHNGKPYSIFELPKKNEPINLLVGGSTALGVGSTSDETTVSSYLSQQTGEVWLNFAGRGYNATQELIMFLMHQKRLFNINNIIVLSGINTLALEGIPDSMGCEHGKYYYSFEFQHYMNKYNEDMKRQKNSFLRKKDNSKSIINQIKTFFFPEKPADIIINDSKVDLSTRIKNASNTITDIQKQWQLLLSDSQASLSFVLQPLVYWINKILTVEEKAVFHAIDHCPNNFYRLFSNILGEEVHPLFYNAIKNTLNSYNIPVYDMNNLLQKSSYLTETLFIDRVHFNDLGNKVLAEIICQSIINKK